MPKLTLSPAYPPVHPASRLPDKPGWELRASLATLLLTSEQSRGEASLHHVAATVSPLSSFQSPLAEQVMDSFTGHDLRRKASLLSSYVI